MVPNKLKRHHHTKHSHLCEKPIQYFRRLISDQAYQAKQWPKIKIISYGAQEASYAIGEIMAKKIKLQLLSQ
jgi:hypothetical protein